MSPDASFVPSIRVSSNDHESHLTPQTDASHSLSTSAPSALGHLVSSDQRQLFDALDKLSACGLPDELSLPQLVVCGDQSSGKSSVLEALTEIDFPRDDNRATTRFATQISLRRARKETLVVTINPHKDRTAEEKEKLKNFDSRIDNFQQLNAELGRVIESATEAMGISNEPAGVQKSRFSKDILNIEVSGPGREHLTLVDLPGLFRNDGNRGEEQMVEAITKSYVDEVRTICLPIVHAGNDIANQGILKIVKAADRDGHRTMGIVTKPDRAEQGSNQSSFYVRLVCNDVDSYRLEKGWHVLRNRSQTQKDISFAERNESERNFFETSVFRSVQPDHRGIATLRTRLSSMLFEHAQKELPKVRKEIIKLIHETRAKLERLGPERVKPSQCRGYLVKVTNKAQLLCRDADKGFYEDGFFAERSEPFSERPTWAIRRLRATITNCYEDFRNTIMERGHAYYIVGDQRMDFPMFVKSNALRSMHSTRDGPVHITERNMMTMVSKKIAASRGREMQGDSNPFVVRDLFKDQSQHWESLAQELVDDISRLCETFIKDVLDETCAADVRANIRASYLQRTMTARKLTAQRVLKATMRVVREQPFDYSTNYSSRLEIVRSRRLTGETASSEPEAAHTSKRRLSDAATQHAQEPSNLSAPPPSSQPVARASSPSGRARSPSGQATLPRHGTSTLFGQPLQLPAQQSPSPFGNLAQSTQAPSFVFGSSPSLTRPTNDMPQIAPAEYHETLDRVLALYETKRTTFIDMVNSLVVEDNLLRDLAQVLSPEEWAANLSDEEVLAFARETDEVHNRRAHLQQLLSGLEEGQRIIDSLSTSG